MSTITHTQLVAALVKPPAAIIDWLTPFTADIWHGATGVAGEGGELLEAILFRKNGEYDRVNIREELGDLYFYIEQLVQRTGIFIDWTNALCIANDQIISGDMALPNAAAVAVHSSQVLDTVKKAAIYNKALDTELLTNQLNTLAMAALTVGLQFGLSQQECLNANIGKLSKRYEGIRYSDKAAQDRADKQTGPDEVVPARKPFKGDADQRDDENISILSGQAERYRDS